MGQNSSNTVSSSQSSTHFESENDLLSWYDKKALKLVSTPELVSYKGNIDGKPLDAALNRKELMRVLRLQNANEAVEGLLFNCVQTLANFPLIKDCYENVTYMGVLKSCVLLNKNRCLEYVQDKRYNHTKLVYISLALNKAVKEMSSLPNSNDSLDAPKVIATFNNVAEEELVVPAETMLEFLTLMLTMSKATVIKNSRLDVNISEKWDSFKTCALSILRTMNTDIVTSQDALKNVISYTQFQNVISSVCPNLLVPLECLMEHVLFLNRDLVDLEASKPLIPQSKLVTEPLLAQLATVWPRELVFSRLQKLYVGRDSGFSMRSFQAKAFKWMAPSILLVQGSRIPDDQDYAKNKNQRYKKFLDEYPRLKDEDQHILPALSGKRKLLFAILINEPWKVTNSELFGDVKTTIVQLSPIQEVYKASKPGNVYFNTLGGGIGIGSPQPIIKPSGVKFVPGNVSLTIDPNLEFAAFRNVGFGGSIAPSNTPTSEHKFLIQDIETWGCGGEKELEEQMKNWEWEEAEAQRRQRINLKSVNDDRALLELAGLVGQNQSGGSV